ncbi:fungal-specific transcription factor domain-containing protein [Trichoderma barbatum]
MLSLLLYHFKPGTPLQPSAGPACDQCRRKKARCDRQQPCQSCKRGSNKCSYDAIPKARGRRHRLRSRTEISDISAPITTSEVMVSGNDAPVPTINAALEVLSDVPTTTEPPGFSDRTDLISVLAIDPEGISEYSTLQGFDEEDTSSNSTSPIFSQRDSTVESYLSEDISALPYPRLDGSDSIVWASSGGAANFIQSSMFMLPRSTFLPYVHVFFERLYPVFPIIDKDWLLTLLQSDEHQEEPLSAGLYSFLAALSAAVIVQLNAADSTFDDSENASRSTLNFRSTFSAQFYMAQCIQARKQRGFIEECDEWTVLTSFFLFAYHGNLDQSRSAWYYLREAIGFIQTLGMDERNTYTGLDTETAERRRPALGPTIDLPRVLESQNPKLAYGFVTLAKVFAAVDEPFMTAWKDQSPSGTVGAPKQASQSIARFLRHSEVEGVLCEVEETQRLDILITHYWLRLLHCQLQIEHSPESISIYDASNAHCILDISWSVLQIISTASTACLESHGIGMEQKVSDVATCLCDILAGLSADEFSTHFCLAPDLLHSFMVFLAGFRNHESQYLGPLAQKATTVLAARLHPSSSGSIVFRERE